MTLVPRVEESEVQGSDRVEKGAQVQKGAQVHRGKHEN